MNFLHVKFFCFIFYCTVTFLFSSCTTPTTTTTNQTVEQPVVNTETNPKMVMGQWFYKLLICSKDGSEKKESDFLITIGQDYLSLSGNELECNQCTQTCTVEEKRIVFSNLSKTCTKMACNYLYRACDNPNTLTNLFQEMDYEVKDNTLVLKSGGQRLTLQRKATDLGH